MSETSLSGSSIPVRSSTEVAELRLIIREMRKLWDRKQAVDVEICFGIGDWFRRVGDNNPAKKSMIVAAFGPGLYKKFRLFGWVAGRWPVAQREGGLPWSHFRDTHADGSLVSKKGYEVPFFRQVGMVRDDVSVVFSIAATGDKEGKLMLNRDELTAAILLLADGGAE